MAQATERLRLRTPPRPSSPALHGIEMVVIWVHRLRVASDRPGSSLPNSNSVKAVVDAYNGTVHLYVSEPDDPMIRGWQKVFPALFQPLESMPTSLRQHLMVPGSLFELQVQQLLRYHVTNPRIFYSGDDVWQVPKELYGKTQIPVAPYHITARRCRDQRSQGGTSGGRDLSEAAGEFYPSWSADPSGGSVGGTTYQPYGLGSLLGVPPPRCARCAATTTQFQASSAMNRSNLLPTAINGEVIDLLRRYRK